MTTTVDQDTISSFVAAYESSLSKVSVKAVGSQVAIMSAISIGTVAAFSFFRPREKKVYAPKIKYQLPEPENPLDDPDYEPPPPTLSNGFFSWLSPVIHLKEAQMIAQIGLDATAFLRFLRLMRHAFTVISVFGAGLLVINIVYNLKYVDSASRNALSLLTLQNVAGNWMWPSLGVSYLINFTVMYFIWRHWQAMLQLRYRWFRSPAYQTKIYSRTLMVTHIRKDYRTDEGLVALMGQLKVDGIKIGPELDCTSIGRRLEDFPEMVEQHNESVAELEKYLVKYLKNGQMGKKRPSLRKGGFLGMGGEKKDAIDYLSKQIKFLRDKIDTKRQAIDSLLRHERHARKKGQKQHAQRIEGENYGFVTFKTISEAHRIARAHRGPLKELGGAELQLAPMPHDIVWQNISKEPAQIASARTLGFVLIGLVCFFNTLPLLVVSILANLSVLSVWVTWLGTWRDSSEAGNWTFSLVSGILPSAVSALFGYFLPIIMRKISRFQGAPTRSRLDRAVTARYFFFMIISNMIVFSLLGVFYSAIAEVILEVGQHKSAAEIFKGFEDIPNKIQGTYVQQSTYWLTWLPLRGFLIFFELLQLIKLALVSLRRFMFSHTPRDIREMTKPGYFEYSIVIVNLLFVAAVGLIYAPLAPLVAIGATFVFWFSAVVYKYQLLYVYVSRAESGGRMWNVYCNRLLACCVIMQLIMVLTTGLIRQRWLDSVAAAPPIIILFVFKIYMSRTAERQFKYYNPTTEELESERYAFTSEKRTRHSEMEKRFLHPALQADKLFTVMVHKSQEGLARDVLSVYPWFAGKNHDGVEIKAIREENLEYDPLRDGPRDEAHQAEWDAQTHTGTEMMTTKSEIGSDYTPGVEAYSHYPLPTDSPFQSRVNLPMDNPSSDHLINQPERSDTYRGKRQQSGPKRYPTQPGDGISSAPLLDYPQYEPEAVPYPPSAYTQPPIGYTPPNLRRTATSSSNGSDRGATRWDAGDLGAGAGAPGGGYGGYSNAQVQGGGYAQPERIQSPPGGRGGNGQSGQQGYSQAPGGQGQGQGQGQGHGW